MQSKSVILFITIAFVSVSSKAEEKLNFPTQLGSYKDPRSSKKHLACGHIAREKMFADADLVFFGKFLSRKEDAKRKVFIDRYKVIRVWKGEGKKDAEFEVEEAPSSDFCSAPRSNRYEGIAGIGGFIMYAKGTPPFIDCCMSESDDQALADTKELDRLDSEFSKLANTVK